MINLQFFFQLCFRICHQEGPRKSRTGNECS